MKRAIGRFGQVLACVAVAVVVGRVGSTLGAVRPAASQPAGQRQAVDSARVRGLLQAARGTNAVLCEIAAMAVDGRSGWSFGSDAGFRAGGASDSVARDIAEWVAHREVSATSVQLLGAALADPDWCVRRLAAPLLGRVQGGSAMPAMLAALAASDASTREMGALALGFAEDVRSVAPLVARLRDPAPRVRATVAWALGEIEHREAVRPLTDALADSDALVRESAAQALGEIEDSAAIPALTDLLKSDRDAAVRRAAARALGAIIG